MHFCCLLSLYFIFLKLNSFSASFSYPYLFGGTNADTYMTALALDGNSYPAVGGMTSDSGLVSGTNIPIIIYLTSSSSGVKWANKYTQTYTTGVTALSFSPDNTKIVAAMTSSRTNILILS